MTLGIWAVFSGIVALLYIVAFAAVRAAARNAAMVEVAREDAKRTIEAEAARHDARADQLRHPDRLREDDGFRRD